MGLLDFLKAAQEKAEEFQNKAQAKADELQKKAESIATQIDTVTQNIKQAIPISLKAEKDVQKHVKAAEHHAKKRDLSIDGISEQILAQRDSMVRNGFENYEFIANHDCCPICRKLNGKHFPVSKLKIGVNAPPMHEGCKCSIAAWEDGEEYEAWLNSL